MLTKLKKIDNKILFDCIFDIFESELDLAIPELEWMISTYFNNVNISNMEFKEKYKLDYFEYLSNFDYFDSKVKELDIKYANLTEESIERIVLFLAIPPNILSRLGNDVINKITIAPMSKTTLVAAYKKFRDRVVCRAYVKSLDILICPYCNINDFSIPNKNEYKSSFQLDHFLSKDIYPFFALSLYNLIPCCSVCNQTKSKNEFKVNPFIGENVNFSIYIDEIIITSDTIDNLVDLDKINIKEKYNSDFSIVKREILEIKDIAERYNESYLAVQDIKGIGKSDYKYWIKKALRDGLVSPDDYGLYRVSKAKSEIVKVAFKENVELYNELLGE